MPDHLEKEIAYINKDVVNAPRYIIGKNFVIPADKILHIHLHKNSPVSWSLNIEDIGEDFYELVEGQTEERVKSAFKHLLDWLTHPEVMGRTIEFLDGYNQETSY